jgi:hypothetical protein
MSRALGRGGTARRRDDKGVSGLPLALVLARRQHYRIMSSCRVDFTVTRPSSPFTIKARVARRPIRLAPARRSSATHTAEIKVATIGRRLWVSLNGPRGVMIRER